MKDSARSARKVDAAVEAIIDFDRASQAKPVDYDGFAVGVVMATPRPRPCLGTSRPAAPRSHGTPAAAATIVTAGTAAPQRNAVTAPNMNGSEHSGRHSSPPARFNAHAATDSSHPTNTNSAKAAHPNTGHATADIARAKAPTKAPLTARQLPLLTSHGVSD
jgi:hypothetical protein